MALLSNTISLSAVTFDNFRANRLDLKLGLPIIIGSFVFAPVATAALLGGYLGNKTAHSILPNKVIKYAIGILSIVFAIKIIFDLMNLDNII